MTEKHGNGNGWRAAAIGALGALFLLGLSLREQELLAGRRELTAQVQQNTNRIVALEQRVRQLEAERKP